MFWITAVRKPVDPGGSERGSTGGSRLRDRPKSDAMASVLPLPKSKKDPVELETKVWQKSIDVCNVDVWLKKQL